MCSDGVKSVAFKAYCTTVTSMYTPQLWWNNNQVSIKIELYVAYTIAIRCFTKNYPCGTVSVKCVLLEMCATRNIKR